MTSQGHPGAIYQRALEARNLPMAVAAAHNLPALTPTATLPLLLLYRDEAPERYPRAAARWAISVAERMSRLDVGQLADLATALELLAIAPDAGEAQLIEVAGELGLPGLAEALAGWRRR